MPTNKRPQTLTTQEAAPTYLTRSVKRRLQQDEQSSLPIPDQLVRHCLSFVGDGSYFFLASVSRQLKRCVEMEFPNDRNTSAESIVATKETFVRFMDAFCADTTVEREEQTKEAERVFRLVQCAIFDIDSVDMYENVYIGIFGQAEQETDEKESFIRSVWPAVEANSIQIMKHIISNDEILSKMKQIDAPDQDEDADLVKIASCVTSACDVEMIEYLRGKGVEFNARSIYFAMRGGRMDTVRHLLDFVPSDVEEMHIIDLLKIAGSACKSEGYEYEGLRVLKEKGWLRGPLLKMATAFMFQWELPVEVLQILLDGQSNADDIIISTLLFSIEKGRHDFLEYLLASHSEMEDRVRADLLARLA
ncbi:predicted protein [Chaetoceros tenuissimus]|uniref:Uncharacterized protein n=1 Tax=Chaetoceros tenuissimus TaxID=426638 RepID=A0AAD3CKH9_9STRA|nr:predicted protein [Chaetoceros tenuissimus]